MTRGEGANHIPWAILIVFLLAWAGEAGSSAWKRADGSEIRTAPRSPHPSEIAPAWLTLGPAHDKGMGRFGPLLGEDPSQFLPPPPPIDLPFSAEPWQPAGSPPLQHADRALALDSKVHIPEPASIVLLTTGLIGLAARRYLRRRSKSIV